MTKGIWYLPEDRKGRMKALNAVRSDKQIIALLRALAKAPKGLSNYEALESINPDYAAAMWVIKQAQSLGLIEYRVHIFGDFGTYGITDLGKQLLAA